MKITHIGSVLLQPFPWVLVKVETDEGLVGIGEAYHGAGVHQIVVDERLQRPLLGQDPRHVDRLYRDMMRAMSASGYYQGIAVDERDRVIVVDRENHRLQLFDVDGNWLETWTDLRQPMDAYVDREGTIYVAEAYQRLSIYDTRGTLLARWGEKGSAPGQFASFLHGVCVDSHGDLYIADESRMQKFERM